MKISEYKLTKLPTKNNKMLLILIIILLVAIGLGGMLRIKQMYRMPEQQESAGVPVQVVSVQHDTVIKSLQYPGTVESYAKSALAAKINERVERVAVSEGDRVSPGDVLVSLNAAELQSKVDTLSRRVETAGLNVRHWESEAQVYKILAEEDAIPQREYANIIYKRDSAAAALREAEALWAEARTALDNTIIRSEIAGVVRTVTLCGILPLYSGGTAPDSHRLPF